MERPDTATKSFAEVLAALPPAARALVEQRLSSSGKPSARDEITRWPGRGPGTPLSCSQRGLWLRYQIDPRTWAYNITGGLRLSGPVNVDALVWSLSEVVRRHDVLRTAIVTSGGEPVAIVREVELEVPIEDLRRLQPAVRHQTLLARVRDHARWQFDRATPPLIRATIVKLSEDEHALLLAIDHLVADGWSIGVLLREVKALYGRRVAGTVSRLPALALQYGDFALWEQGHLSGPSVRNGLAYWRQQLRGITPLNLLTDRPRPTKPALAGARLPFTITQATADRLRDVSRAAGTTLFMTLLAAYTLLLAEYAERLDIVVGTASANRDREELAGLIGLFANVLVLRTNLAGCRTFQDVLRRVKQTTLDAYEHRDVPFEEIVAELRPDRATGAMPLVQAYFTFDGAMKREELSLPGVAVTPLVASSDIAKFDWAMSVHDADELTGVLIYNSELWDQAAIGGVLTRFCQLVEVLSREPERPLAEVANLKAEKIDDQALSQPAQRRETRPAPSHAPRHATETSLAASWAELLSVESVDVNDDFFDLGGHSLLAVRHLVDVERRFGRRISLAEFFEQPTVAGLSALLEAPAYDETGPIVQLQHGPATPPFFCVHPQSGNARCFQFLADRLSPRRPFYAFRAAFPAEEPEPRYPSIEAMATDYVAAMRRVQAEGPYCLGGYSLGSIVAFEMAQQLQAAGHDVALLGLIDGLSPLESRHVGERSDAITLAGIVRDMARAARIPLDLPHDAIKNLSTEAGIALILSRVAASGLTMRSDPAWLRQLLDGVANRLAIVRAYMPSVYDGHVSLFRSTQIEPESAKAWVELGVDVLSPARGWDKLSVRPLSVHRVPGFHATMLDERNVDDLAAVLSSELARACESRRASSPSDRSSFERPAHC
jgi:syringomycin synthetase protein SyrE